VIWSAFILGLVSSLHCVGMCGPIALMIPVDRSDPARKTLQIFGYHAGRITTYASLGLLFGLFGRGLYVAGIQQNLSIAMGIIIIAVAVLPEKYWSKILGRNLWSGFVLKVRQGLGDQLQKKNFRALFLLGFFNGLLPCAMVYMALFGALAMQDAATGAVYMALFGLGTIPLMSAVVYLQSVFGPLFRGKLRKALPIMAVIIGGLFILRGMGLGIPYVSPQATQLFVMGMPDCR
jgi:sulfite exporter TauE/SafE